MERYLKDIFLELFLNDGLTIMGHGLGIEHLLAKFLQYYSEKKGKQKRPLVFCLNVTDYEEAFLDLLISMGVMPNELPKVLKLTTFSLFLTFFPR
jgi:hypothetical protein